MKALGFKDQWVKLIMPCITSVNYSVLVNGKSRKAFIPTQGLRQGDSLSPYLYLMCAEGFSAPIIDADQLENIQGVGVVKGGTSISHLFFVDDNMLFCKENFREWRRVQKLIDIYGRESSQIVN